MMESIPSRVPSEFSFGDLLNLYNPFLRGGGRGGVERGAGDVLVFENANDAVSPSKKKNRC